VDKVPVAIAIIVVVGVVLWLLARSWRARAGRQATLGTLAPPPADLGTPAHTEDLLYVATTRAGAPLERIVVAGLGFRARAVVTVASAGVLLQLAGEEPGFIPRADIRGAGRATWTIDRAVNTDGLVFVRWVLGGAEVDSYLRPTDPEALAAALTALVPARSTP
jgi:hypothetical protein